jgi:hypothetical protein
MQGHDVHVSVLCIHKKFRERERGGGGGAREMV